MKSSLAISDYFILLFIATIFCLGAYTLIKFMRNKD
jgi:hypothetical protein